MSTERGLPRTCGKEDLAELRWALEEGQRSGRPAYKLDDVLAELDGEEAG